MARVRCCLSNVTKKVIAMVAVAVAVGVVVAVARFQSVQNLYSDCANDYH